MPEAGQKGILRYQTERGHTEQLVGEVVLTSDYGYDFRPDNFSTLLRVIDREVFTSEELIGSNATFTVG